MKTLVINEPFIENFCRTQRWAAKTRGRVLRAPDWLAYATAVLEQSKEDVELYDFPAQSWGKDKLKKLVEKKQPDFVVLDSTTPSIYSDIECAKICKEVSDCKVIMVGPHASALPEENLKESEGNVDVIAIGEYDYTVRDIILNHKNMNKVDGVCFNNNGKITRTKPRELIKNLDEIPFPAWHHLDLMKYYSSSKLHPHVDMISGRGCPNRCTFCLWPQVMHGRKYRVRSIKNVVDEMEYDLEILPQLKRGEFFFEDDTLTIDKNRTIELCKEIIKRKLDITWSADSRASNYDLEMFKMMKKSGCRELCVGFESGDQRILNGMKKGLTLEQSKNFMKVARKTGIKVHGCFVLGMPGETRQTIKKTIDFAMSLKLDTLQFSAAVPFPGTEYYNYCVDNKLLKTKSWDAWLEDGEQSGVIDYPGLSKEEVNEAVDKALKKFYFRPNYMIKFLLDTRDIHDLNRKLRSAKNFISYLLGN